LAKQEEKPVPEATLLDLFQGFFHRQDKLLEYMAQTQREMLILLRTISGVPPVLPPTAAPVTVEVTGVTEEALERLMRTPIPVMAYPLGRVKKKGTLASVDTTYTTVCEITVTDGKEFQLANFSLSGYGDDMWAKLMWQDKDLTPVFYVMEHLPFDKWFPPHYFTDEGKPLVGDGKSKLQLKVRAEDGTITVCDGELVGDET
jgi:hypothetical protein